MAVNDTDLARAARFEETLGNEYRTQSLRWLVVGAGAGLFAIMTLSVQQCDPAYAVHALLPSYIAFTIALGAGWGALHAEGCEHSAMAIHLTSAHNREECNQAVTKMFQVFSAPECIADVSNKRRNAIIAASKKHHDRAELAWTRASYWRRLAKMLVLLSGFGIVVGVAWPASYVSAGGQFKSASCVVKR